MDRSRPTVKVLPGVPGMEALRVDDGRVPYPESTQDVVKVLREFGFDVEFTEPTSERRYVGHKAFEVWLPVLEVATSVLAGFNAGILVEIVKTYIGPSQRSSNAAKLAVESRDESDSGLDDESVASVGILHVDWRVTTDDGREERFVANGNADAVMRSLDAFERHVRDL